MCRRIAGNDADAADCTQEALLAVVKGLPKFNASSTFRSWAYRVATNACLDELRRKKRRPVPTDSQVEVGVQTKPTLDRIVVEQIYVDTVLEELDESFRTILVLREVAGLEYREIADCLEIPLGTVRSRISRARKQLLHIFEQSGNNSVPEKRHR